MERKLFVHLLSVVLAVLMAVLAPIQSFASSSAKKYVSELLIVSKEDLDTYKNNEDYYVYETPIYKNEHTQTTDKLTNPGTELYLVAVLTADASDAITDIKALKMKDDFSFEMFEKHLEAIKDDAKAEAKYLFDGPIATLRAGMKDPSNYPAAKTAYDLLNCFLDDNAAFVESNGGKPMPLGELFVSDKLSEKNLDALTDIIFMGNAEALDDVYLALAIACSRDKDNKSFLDYIANSDFADDARNGLYGDIEKYAAQAKKLLEDIETDFYPAITAFEKYMDYYPEDFDFNYRASLIDEDLQKAVDEKMGDVSFETVEDFDNYLACIDLGYEEEDAEKAFEKYLEAKVTNELELFYKGKAYIELLGGQYYYSYVVPGNSTKVEDLNHIKLLDLFLKQRYYYQKYPNQDKDTHLLQELEYITIAIIMQGSGTMLESLSLFDLLNIALVSPEEYDQKLAALKNDSDPDTKAYANNGISIFYGVDSEIFEEGMVAMTGVSSQANTNGDTSWAARAAKLEETAKKKQHNYYIHMIVSGAVAGASAISFAAYAAVTQACYKVVSDFSGTSIRTASAQFKMLFQNSIEIGANSYTVVSKSGIISTVNYGSSSMRNSISNIGRSGGNLAWGILSTVLFVVSLAMLGVSIYEYKKWSTTPLLTDPYREIPAILCDYRTLSAEDELTHETLQRSEYVYYYGVKNPKLVVDNPKDYVKKSLYPAQDGKNDPTDKDYILPRNLGGVQDIYNWELYGDRQWVCLYTTKSDFVGAPIYADSICFDSAYEGLTVRGFGDYPKFNLNEPFNTCFANMKDKNMISEAEQKRCEKGDLYMHYKLDLEAAGAKTSGETFISRLLTGSMIASPTGVALLAGVLALGFGGGAVLGSVGAKKKANKKEDDE